MGHHDAEQDPRLVYDVLLAGSPPAHLLARFPAISVRWVRARTSLRRSLCDASHLDLLLDKVASLGLPLVEVHRLPGETGDGHTYEVLVEGEVGRPLLQYLAWPHHVEPPLARVRLTAASGEMHDFLRACTDCGVAIRRVRVVDGGVVRQPA